MSEKIIDPTLDEMLEELVEGHGNDDVEAINEGIYFFADLWNHGMHSNLYKARIACGFRPSRMATGAEKGSNAEMYFDKLVQKFVGYSPIATREWDNNARAAFAFRAIESYAKAKHEAPEESNINDLITDLLHLKEFFTTDEGQGQLQIMLENAMSNYTEDVGSATDLVENADCDTLTYNQNLHNELKDWLKEMKADKELPEWMPPKKVKQ